MDREVIIIGGGTIGLATGFELMRRGAPFTISEKGEAGRAMSWQAAGMRDLRVGETWAGLRPASRDPAPLLGRTTAPGVLMATGHARHGVLLTPFTAEEMAELIWTGETSDWIAPFSSFRFSEARSPTHST